MKEPPNEVNKNAFSLVRTNSHCKGYVIVHVQQKSLWLYLYFYSCHIALWTSLQLENTSTTDMNTDWKPLQIYNSWIFMDLKRPLSWHYRCTNGTSDAHYREVSAIKCPLHRGFVMRVWLSFHPFLRKVSVVERCPL